MLKQKQCQYGGVTFCQPQRAQALKTSNFFCAFGCLEELILPIRVLFRVFEFFLYFCKVKKKLLFEISIIRPLIIFLLVVYHSLCVFTGGWAVPQGVSPNAAYWWMGHLISGFRIETIAFVGGYVFCYQCFELGKRKGFFGFLWKKFKRLIIPCFVFGIVYYLLFRFNTNKFNWQVAFWRVANGIEHLWFLPMLFWCFLVCWLIDRLLQWLHARHGAWFMPVGWFLLAGLAAVSLLRVSGLKLGLSRVPYFLFYFYLGYWLRILLKRNAKENGSAGFPLLFMVLWVLYFLFLMLHLQATHLILPGFSFQCPHWLRGCSQLTLHLFAFAHTACGILALYFTVAYWLRRYREPDSQPGPFLRQCSRLCYGVYVFHMFFMKPFYYNTPFPAWCAACGVGEWLMPWVVLSVTLGLSILVTWLLLKTRFGRFLIG